METGIVLSRRDLQRLRAILGSQRHGRQDDREHLLHLMQEMDRATIGETVPADVVGIDSTVIVLDMESAAHNYYTLVLPAQADVAEGRLSVLAPLGTALLGCRVGDIVEWRMPGGLRRLQIEGVQHGENSGGTPPAGRHLAAA